MRCRLRDPVRPDQRRAIATARRAEIGGDFIDLSSIGVGTFRGWRLADEPELIRPLAD
jgi:hypothetical protein